MKNFIYSIVLIFVLILQSCNSSKSIEGEWVPENPTEREVNTIMKIIKIDEKIYKIEFWEKSVLTNTLTVPFEDNILGEDGRGFSYSPKEDKLYISGTDIVLIHKKEK